MHTSGRIIYARLTSLHIAWPQCQDCAPSHLWQCAKKSVFRSRSYYFTAWLTCIGCLWYHWPSPSGIHTIGLLWIKDKAISWIKSSPDYLDVKLRETTRFTRSTTNIWLNQPVPELITIGGCAYSISAPRLWNELPKNLKVELYFILFKRNLKTYLFQKHYT